MMRLAALLLLLSAAGAAAQQEMASAPPEEPLYKVLFESGYYSQALEYLDTRLATDDSTRWQELRRYRAFCLIMLGRREEAVKGFAELLDADTAFLLDPILTSPKIYEVFHEARNAWLATRAPAQPVDTAGPPPDSLAGRLAADTSAARLDTGVTTSPRRPAVAVCLLPFGAGQFASRRRAEGVTLALLQAAGLVSSIVSYAAREQRYDSRYGWYSGNAAAYADYTTAYRLEFGLFGLAYLYSVGDGLVHRARAGRSR